MTRLGVVSPATALRLGLRAMLDSAGLAVVFDAARLADLEDLPDVDVLVLSEAALARGDLGRLLGAAARPPGVLLLTDDPEGAPPLWDLPARGWGVLSADATAEELLAAVQAVAAGLMVGSPEWFGGRRLGPAPWRAPDEAAPQEALTERESEVLQWLAQGLGNKQIAQTLGISEHTVKFHVSAIYGKLGATNRAEAVRIGVRRGLITF